ncbi:hypothetical protein JZ751_000006 [Albula glossodonta]|uniref:Rho GTPase-activating protein 21 n=1 Tax=Albula glossodonta TaxID=121402 RepID=A0A8T2PV68_9TELE|nr:hypothetical protein JZ751_000006 [Albula glossodonta]
MDTIFVKQVKEGGPAHGAGLCTGDRIVKVNGESIIGKTYSQVIALIQNSDAVLELCVMPKDEDILQLAYSQDAYLKGHEAYSGNAHNIPEPPPLCYPRVDAKSVGGMAQNPDSAPAPESRGPEQQTGGRGAAAVGQVDLGYRVEIPVPPSPPPPLTIKPQTAMGPLGVTVATVTVAPDAPAPVRRAEDRRYDPSALVGGRPQMTGRPPQYPSVFSPSSAVPFPPLANHYPSSHAPPPPPPPSTTAPSSATSHQNIDWRTYKTYREYVDNKRGHTYGCRTIQERLDSLRAADYKPPPFGAQSARRRSTSHDRGGPPCPVSAPPPRSVSQDRIGVGSRLPALPRDWSHPGPVTLDSQGSKPKARARSCDFLDPVGERRGYGRTEVLQYREGGVGVRPGRLSLQHQRSTPGPAPSHHQPPPLRTPPAGGSYGNGFRVAPTAAAIAPTHFPTKGTEQQLQSHVDVPSAKDQRAPPALNHLPPSRARTESAQELPSTTKEAGLTAGARSASCSAPSPTSSSSNGPTVAVSRPQANGKEGAEPAVVLRGKPPTGRQLSAPQPLRHPSYILAVNDGDPEGGAENAVVWLPNDARREVRMQQQEQQRRTSGSVDLDDSLDSIPYIDEPASPSADHGNAHIPASAVICVAPAITTVPPSPTPPCPLMRRQLSHDQDSLRNTILESQSGTKTERSKSYDEGLDNYREEGRARTSVKHLTSLRGLRKALDGHKSSDDSGSRRDSSSDVFSDSSKEGWLHFRQLNTEKSKRVGGGMRWKQMYAVLRGHSLYLYKDRREGLAHAAAAANSQPENEPQPISIKACLIDISYSDTKRKNVLRLTTSHCEYLFQAEDREDMLSWIRVIQENSNLDDECQGMSSISPGSKTEPSPKSSRQSLSIKQALLGKGEPKTPSPHSPRHDPERKAAHKDDSSPPRDKGTWRKGIPGLMRKPFEKKTPPGVTFGVRLDDCPPAQTNRVRVTVKLGRVRTWFRALEGEVVPGNNAAISSMQEELNKGMSDIDMQDDLHQLPDHHYETLKFLSAHLKTVSENCEKNKMEPRNLAIVFGPTLVRTSEDNMTHMVTHMPDQYKIVETLIQHYDWFFTEEDSEEPTTSVPQESAVESQPVPNIDHLLTNIGRTGLTSPGEVSDSPTSDSARSKGSWGSGKEQYSRELLRSSIFAAASRKRKKHKEKPLPSSSDDDLDAVFPRKESQKQQSQKQEGQGRAEPERAATAAGSAISAVTGERKESGQESEEAGGGGRAVTLNGKPEQVKDRPQSGAQLPSSPSPSPSPSLSLRHQPAGRQSSQSEPTSQCDDATSDLGTMHSSSSQASGPAPTALDAAPDTRGNEAVAEVSSITSDYSTTSSLTFLPGAEPGGGGGPGGGGAGVGGGVGGGDEADDERSELVSEGRPAETDSESDFPVFPKPSASAITTPASKTKTDSESSTEGVHESEKPAPEHVSEVPGKGRSSGSLSSSSRSESERVGPPWRLRITERLKFRLRTSADDMFGVGGGSRGGAPKARSSPEARKKKSIRRRHTMGGQRDFAELAAVIGGDGAAHHQGGEAELSAVDRLKPKCSSQDFSIRDWLVRERGRSTNGAESRPDSTPLPSTNATPTQDCLLTNPATPSLEQLNGESLQGKTKPSLSPGADAHPHKLSGAQVVRSRFYQYL